MGPVSRKRGGQAWLSSDVHLVTGQATLSPQAFPDVELSTAEIFA
jgi:hypothetical protein